MVVIIILIILVVGLSIYFYITDPKAKTKLVVEEEKEQNKVEGIDYFKEKQNGKACMLDEHGKMQVCNETAYLDKHEEEGFVLYYPADNKHYHVFLGCFNNWEYKEEFNYWRCITITEAKEKGLTMCPYCAENLLPKEEKLKKIIQGKDVKYITLMGSATKNIQETLFWVHFERIYLTKVSIEYDLEKNKYLVKNNYDELLGCISEATINKLDLKNIENLFAYVNKVEINKASDKWICEIVVILE